MQRIQQWIICVYTKVQFAPYVNLTLYFETIFSGVGTVCLVVKKQKSLRKGKFWIMFTFCVYSLGGVTGCLIGFTCERVAKGVSIFVVYLRDHFV